MKITSFKVAACLSVLIHGGIGAAYYELHDKHFSARVDFQAEQVTVLEVLSDPVETSQPVAVKTEVAPKVPPQPKPITPSPEVKPLVANPRPEPPQEAVEPLPVVPAPAVAQPSPAIVGSAKAEAPAELMVSETESGSPANYLFNPRPVYPAECRRKKQEGLVIVAVQVSWEGLPERIQVVQSSKVPLLDRAAVAAVGGWRFSPARFGNTAMTSLIEVPIRFKLSILK